MVASDIKEKYDRVAGSLEEAVAAAEDVEITGEEENKELEVIISTLNEINNEFKEEIEKLESSSEWDKFCIAFFGETNAGKSTIIESLRIIYDEEQRRLERLNQERAYERELVNYSEKYKETLDSLKAINISLIEAQKSNKLSKVLKCVGLVALGICIGFALAYCIF